MKKLLLISILVIIGCKSEKVNTTPVHKNSKGIIIKFIEYDDGEIQGEILNKSSNNYKEVVLKLDFYTGCGKKILTKKFKVVPGKDKKILKTNFIKHFRYKIRINPQRPYLKVVGEVISVK
jgi:hypothetical protein